MKQDTNKSNATTSFLEGFFNWMEGMDTITEHYKKQGESNEIIRFDGADPGCLPFQPALEGLLVGIVNYIKLLPHYAAANEILNRNINVLIKYIKGMEILPVSDFIENNPPDYRKDNFAVGTGSTNLYKLLLSSIRMEPKHVFLITSPTYGLFSFQPLHRQIRQFMPDPAKGLLETLKLKKQDNYKINPESLDKKIKEIESNGREVRLFLHINPNNPLGTVEEKEDISELAKVLRNYPNMIVIDDLAYAGIEYDGKKAAPLASVPGMPERTITLFSLSKSYCIPSFRCGFAYGRNDILSSMQCWNLFEMDSPPVTSVFALMGALNPDIRYKRDSYLKENAEEYKFRRDYVHALINGYDSIADEEEKKLILEKVNTKLRDNSEIDKETAYTMLNNGIPGLKLLNCPESGYFQVLDFSEYKDIEYNGNKITTSVDLTNAIAKLSGVVILPGEVMHFDAEEMVGRITYALPYDTILKGMVGISQALKKLKS